MRRMERRVFAFTFFYKARAHYFLRWCFRVLSLELIYLLLRCPGGGKEIGTCLYHITISWSVEWIGGWGISCIHAVLLNWFFRRSAVSSRLSGRGLFMIRLVPDWATWAITVFPPFSPNLGQPITLSVRLQSSQESSGVQPNPPSVYTHACNTQTHTLEISTNAEGAIGKQRARRRGINHDTHTQQTHGLCWNQEWNFDVFCLPQTKEALMQSHSHFDILTL